MAVSDILPLRDMHLSISNADTKTLLQLREQIERQLTPRRLQACNQTSSPLLRLSRELRDEILSHVLIAESSIVFENLYSRPWGGSER